MKQILCFGDSNTYGLVPGKNERYSLDSRWTGILERKLNKKNVRVIEEGLCGRTTVFEDEIRSGRKGIDVINILVESHYPLDRIIIMLGTNDCKTIYNASAEVIGKGVENLINKVKSIDSKLKILLISPIWLSDGVWEYDPEFNDNSIEKSKKLKSVYLKAAKKHGCDFLAASDYVKASAADREHLGEEEHKILADIIYQKLKKEV